MKRVLRGWLLSLAVAAGLGALPARAAAQGAVPPDTVAPGDTLYELRMADGSSYVGRVARLGADSVTLVAGGGAQVTVPRAQVRSMRPAPGRLVHGAYWRPDPSGSRLFFSPTARTIPAGSGYFGVYEIYVPFVAYGVTDRLVIAGGSPFYLAFLDAGVRPPVYAGPKLRVLSTPTLSASLGGLFVWVPHDSGDDDTFGVVYGVGTYGSADRALTLGLGWGYQGTDLSSRPVVMAGGETRVSRSVKLVTENLFVPGESGVVFSGGARLFGERLSADAGLAGFADSSNLECCVPLVNFVYHLGPH